MKNRDYDFSAGQKFEAIFSLFLVALAFLSRDNPGLVTPWIYVFFLLLLTLNLIAGYILHHWPTRLWMSTFIIMANCAVITGIVAFSGAADSNLWVLYLLPIFTACVFLKQPQVILVTIGTLSFNLVFYVGNNLTSDGMTLFQAGVKSGTIFFASAMTWWIASRDNHSREKLRNQRREISEIEEKIQTQKLALTEMEKLADVGQISAGVAHDLNNPLTVILGTVKVLLEDEETPGTLRYDLERILRSATLCHNITTNLLDLSKDRSFSRITMNPGDLVDSTLQIYGEALAEHNIEVVRDISNDLPSIYGSQTQLQRVLLNLLVNAKDVMDKGGRLKILVKGGGALSAVFSRSVQVVVEDTGPGISVDFMQRIFKPFNTTKRSTEGTGLGLYLSREIVMRHGGQLTVQNLPEGGARFIIHLPLAEDALKIRDHSKESQAA